MAVGDGSRAFAREDGSVDRRCMHRRRSLLTISFPGLNFPALFVGYSILAWKYRFTFRIASFNDKLNGNFKRAKVPDPSDLFPWLHYRNISIFISQEKSALTDRI